MEPDAPFDTVQMHAEIERLRQGNRAAADVLLVRFCSRLERLARTMLRGFPNVKRWADTDDVLQGSLVRLLRTLQAIRPESTREFVNLAAVHIRRELLDLARSFRGRREETGTSLAKVPDRHGMDADLDQWTGFHEQVEKLPVLEREIVGLTFYHGWTQTQIAELLAVDERTVRRRWRAAYLKLSDTLGGKLPDAGEEE